MAGTKSEFRMDATQVDVDHLRKWIAEDIDDELTSTKGIGPKAAEKLRENGINTTTALVGRFLVCKKSADMSAQEIANEFYDYLRNLKIDSHRSTIVRYIGGKANVMVPGIFRERDLE